MIGVAFEAATYIRWFVGTLAEGFACLVGSAANAEPLRIPHWLTRLHIEYHQRGREAMCQVAWNMTDSPALALDVEERNAALSGSIELKNLRNGKPILKPFPHFRRQSIATSHPDAMGSLVRRQRSVHQVPAKFADVLEHCTVPPHDVIPELARGKFLSQHDCAAGHQNCPRRLYP